MRRLVYILKNNELIGCLEADLMRFYQVDLRHLFTDPRTITYRQVVTWTRHLPADSALARRGFAGDQTPSLSERLQVAVFNEIRLGRYDGTDKEPELIDLNPEESDG